MRLSFLLVGLLLPLQTLAQGEFLEGKQSGFAVGLGATDYDRHMLYSMTGGYSWHCSVDLSLAVGRFNLEGPNRTLGAVQLAVWPARERKHVSIVSFTCFASAQYVGPVSSYGLGAGVVKRIPLSDSRVSDARPFLSPSLAYQFSFGEGTANLSSAMGALSLGIPAGRVTWIAITGHCSKSFSGHDDTRPAFGAALTFVYGSPRRDPGYQDDTEW